MEKGNFLKGRLAFGVSKTYVVHPAKTGILNLDVTYVKSQIGNERENEY